MARSFCQRRRSAAVCVRPSAFAADAASAGAATSTTSHACTQASPALSHLSVCRLQLRRIDRRRESQPRHGAEIVARRQQCGVTAMVFAFALLPRRPVQARFAQRPSYHVAGFAVFVRPPTRAAADGTRYLYCAHAARDVVAAAAYANRCKESSMVQNGSRRRHSRQKAKAGRGQENATTPPPRRTRAPRPR